MFPIPPQYLNQVYAGWLGKIIGIRHGAQTEGWTYDKIQDIYGEITDYPVPYRDFAADDDSNVPLFFLRTLEHCADAQNPTPQEVAHSLLNYAPYEHGFFWWGGYGVSTEHTAYLNLRAGIPAPRSGSTAQNGLTIAEQIGGQIFIDTWGLVAPGNPDLAAKFAQGAASVTHDGNGVYGGIFVAVCVSLAFVETEITTMINRALTYIPADSEYTRVVKAVLKFHSEQPGNWRDCYEYVRANFGYDRYAGSCHIIPNAAVLVLSLLYGGDSFSHVINICNMCGWDTDCNVANAGCITGVRLGLDAIEYKRWREPINDLLVCSSVVGSLNLMDLPYGASYIASLAYSIAEQSPPPLWQNIWKTQGLHSCHFEYPGSTHAMRVRGDTQSAFEYSISNSDTYARTGDRSLKVTARRIGAGEKVFVHQRTHCQPADLHDSRYDPCFSPLIYPGQTISGSVYIPQYSEAMLAQMYVWDENNNKLLVGPRTLCATGQWYDLSFDIPPVEGGCLGEAGFIFIRPADTAEKADVTVFVDDLVYSGRANYTVDFAKERLEPWPCPHREISQFTALKGVFYLEKDKLHLSCSDFAELYTGRYDWDDYTVTTTLFPQTGAWHGLNFRVQGAMRSYAAVLTAGGTLSLMKNMDGYRTVATMTVDWEVTKACTITVTVQGATIAVGCGDQLLCWEDNDHPFLQGSIGLSTQQGSHCAYRQIAVSPPKEG